MNRIGFWRRGLTQEQFSLATGINRARLGLIERHFSEPSENEMEAISRVLRVPVKRLGRDFEQDCQQWTDMDWQP